MVSEGSGGKYPHESEGANRGYHWHLLILVGLAGLPSLHVFMITRLESHAILLCSPTRVEHAV